MTSDLRIVGIDPGTTAAVAVLDLDGGLVDYASRKEFRKDELIRFIVDAGKPLLIGADVAPAPARVAEVASNMGAELVVPDTDLDAGYKDELVAGFPVADADAHTRDAVAAAEHARRRYAETFDDVRRRVDAAGVPEQFDDVVELVVGAGMAVSDAVGEVGKAEPEEPADDAPETEPDWARVAARRKRRIDVLERKVANLEEYIDELEDDEVDETVPDTELRRRNRTICEQRGTIDELEARLERAAERNERLRRAVERLRDGWRYVPRVERPPDAESPVVAVEGYDGGPVPDAVATVVAPAEQPALARQGIDVVVAPEDAVDLGDGMVVAPDVLNAETDGEEFMEWLEAYRQR